MSNRKKLYEALVKDYDMGTFEQFEKDIQDDTKRRKLYDAIIDDYDMGSYEQFSSRVLEGLNVAADGSVRVASDNSTSDGRVVVDEDEQEMRDARKAYYDEIGYEDALKRAKQDKKKEGRAAFFRSLLAAGAAAEGPMYSPTAADDVMAHARERRDARADVRTLNEAIEGAEEGLDVDAMAQSVGAPAVAEVQHRAEVRERMQEDGTIDRMKEMRKEARKEKRQARRAAMASAAMMAEGFAPMGTDERVMEQSREWSQNKLMAQTLDEALDKADAGEIDGVGKEVRQGLNAFWDSASRAATWDFGASDALNGVTLYSIIKKWEEDPESLTATEQKVLDALGMATAVEEAYRDQLGVGYGVGESLPVSMGFMASMALNPASGFGKALSRQAVRRYGRNSVMKNVARLAGDVDEVIAMTFTTGAGRVVADAMERINGRATYDIDPETGMIEYGGQKDQVAVADAFLKAIVSNYIENYTETIGNYMNFDPLYGLMKGVAAKGLRKVNLNKWADALTDVSPAAMTSKMRGFKEMVKFDGVLGEIMEEEIGMAMNALFVGDNKWSDFLDAKTQLTTIMSCTIMSAVLNGYGGYQQGRVRRQYEKNVEDREREAQRLLGDKFADLRDRIDLNSPEGVVDALNEVYQSQDYTLEQKRALANYASARVGMQYYNESEAKARRGLLKEEQQWRDAYEAGRAAQLPAYYNIDREYRAAEAAINERENAEEMWDAIAAINRAPAGEVENILNGFSEEDKQLINNWRYNAARWSGAINHRAEQVQDLVDEYAGQVTPYVQPDGTVTTAIYGDRVVYVSNRTDKTATIWTHDGARKEMVPIGELEHVQTHNAEELIERFRNEVTPSVEEETDRYMEYPAEVQEPAVNVEVQTADGNTWLVTAVNGDEVQVSQMTLNKKDNTWVPSGEPRTMTREEFMDWQLAELERKEANTYEQGEALTFYVNGTPVGAEVRAVTPDGEYEVQIERPMDGLNKAVVDTYTAEELRALTQWQEELPQRGEATVDNVAETADNEGAPVGEIEQGVSEEVTDGQNAATVSQPTEQGGNVNIPAAEVAEDVNTPQAKATELLAELEEDEVDENIAYNAQKALDAAEKTRKAKPTMKDADGDVAAFKALKSQWQAELDEAQREVLFWDNVAKEVQRQREARMSEQVAMPAQAPVAEAVEAPSVSPIAEAAPVAKPKRAKRQRQTVSFDEFGEAAMEAAGEILKDMTPQNGEELVAWMLTGPKGIKLIPESFRDHTGYSKSEQRKLFQIIAKKENGGVTIERFGELVMLADREDGTNFFDQSDANAGLNAVLELLSQVETIGDINNYILRNREEMAYREASAVQAAEDAAMQETKDAWYMEQYHATEEELAAYNEYLAEFAEEIYGEDADYEQRIATFAEIQLGEYDNQGTDAGLRSSADQGEGLTSDREGGRSVGETEQLDRREVPADAAGVAEAEDGRAGGSVSAQSDVDTPKPRRKPQGFKKTPSKSSAELFAEEKQKVTTWNNAYSKVIVNSETAEEAIAEFRRLATKARERAEDWRDRVYKKNKTVVTGQNKTSGADEYETTIEAANERRRQGQINSALKEAEEYWKFAATLADRVGIDAKFDDRQARIDRAVREYRDNVDNSPEGIVNAERDWQRYQENLAEDAAETVETLENGDVHRTNLNSNGEIATVVIERDGNVISVDTYENGALFERTDYDANGNATKVTRYKDGEVVSEQEYKDGKRKVTANVFEMAEEAQKERNKKKSSKRKHYGQGDSNAAEKDNREPRDSQLGGTGLPGRGRGENGRFVESAGGRNRGSSESETAGRPRLTANLRRVLVDWSLLGEKYAREIENMPPARLRNDIRRYQARILAIDDAERLRGIDEDLSNTRDGYKARLDYARAILAQKDGNKWGVEDVRPVPLGTIVDMFNEWNEDADIKSLFDRVFDVFKQFDINIVFDDSYNLGEKRAYFDAREGRIVLPMHMVYSDSLPNQDKASLTLHEMIHGVVQYVLYAYEIGPEKRAEKGYTLTDDMLEVAKQLNEIYENIKGDARFAGLQGVKDVHEMVSELSDPKFRSLLKETTILDEIVEALKRLFGINVENNALDGVSKALDYILDNYSIANYNILAERSKRMHYSLSSEENLRFRDDNNAELKEKYTDEQIFDAAKQKFGVTDDIREAGYILPDGSMLDFSGRYAVDGDASHLKGGRHMDHREVNQIAYDANDNETGLETNMTDFIERGAIRIHYSNSGVGVINLNIAPTKEQKAKLRQLISAHNGNMDVDFGNGWNTEHHAEYDKAKPTRILGDIDRYYSEGVRPEGNILYRDGAPFFSNAERAVENIKQQKATPEQWLAMIKKDGGLKAGEDKWMGLSDWLNEQKEKGVKTLTKDEVLQFIRENQIEIEEVEYGDLGDTRLEELQAEFDELVGLGEEETGSIYTSDWADLAFEAMVERYGDDFREAFRVEQGYNTFPRLEAEEDYDGNMSDAAKYFLGANPINSTRLDYTTEGLDNKKEIAFVVPSIESWNRNDEVHFGDAGEGRAVAWVRFGETTDEEGNRVLVIDEVQSKRHDEGRAKGYYDGYEEAEIDKLTEQRKAILEKQYSLTSGYTIRVEDMSEAQRREYEDSEKELQDTERSIVERRKRMNGVPDAPFDKNYHELVMKRMLRYAAENGFDKVAWTKGAQQAQRYGLSSKVSSIEYKPLANGHYNVTAYGTNGYPIEGVPVVYNNEQEIAETFGRGIAEKIVNDIEESKKTLKETNDALRELKERRKGLDEDSEEYEEIMEEYARLFALQDEANSAKSIEGEDLSIGGEDRVALYDEMIPRFMNKYTKKWGTKVGEVTLPNVEEAGRTMWSVDVTPEMRESVMQGQPMFREGMGAVSDREVSYENDPIAKFMGKPRYYGKRAAAFAERERRRMAQAAEATAKTLGLDVEVVTDAATASQLTQQRMKRRPKAKGWYDVETGKIVVVVPNHVSAGDAVRTVLHEGVAHHGLRELFGDGFDAMLDNIYNNVAPELKARIDSIAERTGVSIQVATEEYLASLAEETNFEYAQRTGWWTKIKGYFMKMLRKLGMPGLTLREEITDNELRYLLWRSYQNLVDPNSYLKPLGYLDDVAKQKELKVGEYAENTMATPRAADIDAIEDIDDIEDAEAEEWAEVTMQRIEELEAQAVQLENEIADMEADRDADDESRYDVWEQQIDPLRKQLEDVYAEIEGLYSLDAYEEDIEDYEAEREAEKQRQLYQKRIDNAYINAVREGNWEEATDLFRQYVLSKAEDEGIVPMDYGVGYRGGAHSSIAKKVKEENPDAIAEAAYQMSIRIPKGSILVPMPSRTGNATYTVKLAEAIAKATDSEVRDVLKGKARMSVYEAKKKGIKMTPEDLGMYTTEELPKGKNIVIIDNVIDKGTTALAAVSAVKGASVVAYSYTLGDKQRVATLKLAEPVTYDDNMRIIPLSRRFDKETDDIRYRLVDDQAEIERLESEPTIKAYRAMQVINGELYPPMSAVVDGKLREPIALGQWEQSEERPDLADDNGRFKLDKGNKKSLKAAYNPYFHSSSTPLNDQFSEAQDRDNLVTVEVEVPASEADGTSEYKAEKAKDAVGTHQWKAGIIQGQLTGTREVFLTRWDKPIRIVPESEVADVIVEMFDGKDIVMPSNVVTPQLRKELEARGITFVETDNQGKLVEGERKGEHYSKVYGKKTESRLRYRGENLYTPQELAQMETPIHKSKGGFKNLAEAEAWAKKNLQGQTRTNQFTGDEISVNRKSVNEMLAPKFSKKVSEDVHMKALQSVLDFIETGIPAEVHKDTHGRDFDVMRLYNAIDIDGKVYRVKSTVRKVKEGDKYYTYEVQKMELIEDAQEALGLLNTNDGGQLNSTNSISGAKLLKGVKKTNSNEEILPQNENLRNSEEIIAEVERESAALGVPVRIVRSVDELPDEDTRKRAVDGQLKGYFDPRTGEVALYEPNTDDANDAKRTILHETVGHKGLRQLVGEQRYDKAMVQLMYMLPSEVRDAVLRRAERHGWNAAIAMDEYLAEQAERDVQPTWWGKVNAKIRALLRNMGFNVMLTDADVTYLLWRSRKKLQGDTAFDMATDAILKQAARKSAEAEAWNEQAFKDMEMRDFEKNELKQWRYRTGEAKNEYERHLETISYKFSEAYQDRMASLKVLQEAVEKESGKKIADWENAWMDENRMSSVNLAEIEMFRESYLERVAKEGADIEKSGVKHQKLIDYMFAKHGLERNETMARERAEKEAEGDAAKEATLYAKYRDNDFAGLTALTGKGNVADAEADAMQMVSDFEANHSTDLLWGALREANNEILRISYDAGIIDEETYNNLRDKYKYYIPLRGFAEKTAEDVYLYVDGHNSPYNAPIKTAKGRKSKADDPFAHIESMATSAIVEANRNRLKQKMLYMAERHHTGLMSVSDVWVESVDVRMDDGTTVQEWHTVFANIPDDATTEQAIQIQKAFEEDMEQKAKSDPDKYAKVSEKPNIPYRVVKQESGNQHQIVVKRGGKDVVIIVNGNPRAAQAVNGLTNRQATENKFIRSLRWVNRQQSANYTARNPVFMIRNLTKDSQYTKVMAFMKEPLSYGARFWRNWWLSTVKVPSLLAKYKKTIRKESGGLDMSKPIERMFYEFISQGGETGYTHINTIEDYKKEMKLMILKHKGGIVGMGIKSWDALTGTLRGFNQWAEDTSRFAAYMTSRETGRSLTKSVNDAKEISVNFNRAGSGSRMVGEFSQSPAGYIAGVSAEACLIMWNFFNANVQGISNFYREAAKHPYKFAVVVGANMLYGFLHAMIASAGDDDEDKDNKYYDLPAWKRRMCHTFRVGDKWLCIPMAISFAPFYALGELAYSYFSGREKYTDSEIAAEVAKIAATAALPVDVTTNHWIVPDALSPALEVAWFNEDWTGKPIYKERYDDSKPTWELAYKSTNPRLVAISKAINEATNKDVEVVDAKGNVTVFEDYKDRGWADNDFWTNAAGWEHMMEGYLGGNVKFVNDIAKSIQSVKNIDLRNVQTYPIVNSFIMEGGEKVYVTRGKVYEAKKEIQNMKSKINSYYRETMDSDLPEADRKRAEELREALFNRDMQTITTFEQLEEQRQYYQTKYDENPNAKEIISTYDKYNRPVGKKEVLVKDLLFDVMHKQLDVWDNYKFGEDYKPIISIGN